jgi:hypothetical protein
MSGKERDYIDPHTIYNDDDEDITVGLPDDDKERPEPSTIPNENGEYNF